MLVNQNQRFADLKPTLRQKRNKKKFAGTVLRAQFVMNVLIRIGMTVTVCNNTCHFLMKYLTHVVINFRCILQLSNYRIF